MIDKTKKEDSWGIQGVKIFLAGFIVWLIGTAYGGFREEPIDNFERMTDFVGATMMFWGILKDILSGVTVSKSEDVHIKEAKITCLKEDVL